jgi:paired small multidrug resistance pump
MGFEIHTVAGVVGSALIMVAYAANQQEWLSARDWRYSVVNLLGALLILWSLYHDWNLAAAVMEIFWVAISLYGLWRALGLKRRTQ